VICITRRSSSRTHADFPRPRKARQRDRVFRRQYPEFGKTKLFKLLYLLDFHHFRETGRSVTGLEYRAWKHGPVPFDDSHFTKRELRLMQELAERHRDDMTPLLIGLTHEERGPWDKIWDGGRGNEARIPYALAVPDDHPNRDAVLKRGRNPLPTHG